MVYDYDELTEGEIAKMTMDLEDRKQQDKDEKNRVLRRRMELEKEGKTSMLYWYPKIKDLLIPQPKTIIIELEDFLALDSLMEQDGKSLLKYWDDIMDAVTELKLPVFLRTDLSASKHDYTRTCYVEDLHVLRNHIARLVEFHHLGILPMPYKALVFREFIELDWKFKAFRGLPIAPERRYFVNGSSYVCNHAYWPEASIRSPVVKEGENWQRLLKSMNDITFGESTILTSYAKRIGKILGGYWSVDFAKGRDGKWYLIDLANGYESYHVEGCEKILPI